MVGEISENTIPLLNLVVAYLQHTNLLSDVTLNKGKNKAIYVYFIKQKLFGYSPSLVLALMMDNTRKAFA